ncbi:MAG TPA: hypothetical protein RMH99_20555, partial [Sandaracinaceae bacterium LLY-WYZ-13_1]|nr:hypothetical protein [Sandaracinaceae bacterium LLY-WYZ-13_1]
MKYLCVHCDKTFEHDDEDEKPRCPKCLRVNGLEPVGTKKKDGEASERPPWLTWAVAGGVLVAAGIGYAVWAGQSADNVSGEAPLAPLDRSAVLGYLRARGVDARELEALLVPDDAVEDWADEVAGDASGAGAKAEAIQEAIRACAEAGAFERWSFGVPRDTPVAPPARVLERLGEDDAMHHLYPIEVAALMASALRAEDVTAMVADVVRFPGDRRPPDPSGEFGYYVVAVYPGDSVEGDPTYYDPYGGREVQPEEARVLSDLQAIGAALSTRALYLLSRESEPERAMEASGQAVRLDGRSPSNRAVRGAILIAAGQANEAIEELESAKQLRPDAPRRNLLAMVHMARQDLDAASREVTAALEESPDFGPGHATLAAIHMARGEADQGRTELEEAERIDPQWHQLPQLWAMYYATTGDLDRAVERAQQAVERNPDIQTRLMAARIYRQAARYDLMRREAHAVLERTPSQRAAEMREMIRRMLGPTALEPVDEELASADEELGEGAEGDELGLGDPDSLRLESDLLGDEAGDGTSLGGGRGGPSLLGDDE